MPNPTSKLNLVINGTTTQLDIHDANAVDLTNNQTVAGNKEFTGTTTAHDLVPSATDTYNLGSSNYQWNNAYIKSLTINGVACGDILTHNASEFVDVSSNQTIGGIKTFSDGLFVSRSTAGDLVTLEDSSINSTNEDANGMPLTGHTNSLKIKGSQFNVIPCMLTGQVFTSGNTSAELRVYKYKDTSRMAAFNIYYTYASNTALAQFINCNISTNADGVYSIGSSIRRFNTAYVKAINDINPGALSLPGSYVNVDTTNWVLDGSNVNSFTPTSDGWLGIQVTDTVYDQMHYVFVGRNDSASYYQQNVLSPINALWDGEYHGCVFIPVVKNFNYDIRCICSTIIAKFYPCQGNV